VLKDVIKRTWKVPVLYSRIRDAIPDCSEPRVLKHRKTDVCVLRPQFFPKEIVFLISGLMSGLQRIFLRLGAVWSLWNRTRSVWLS